MLWLGAWAVAATASACSHEGEGSAAAHLMNVSFDASRTFYAAYNTQFAEKLERERHVRVAIKQTHGGSGKQARAVIDGLDADVVSLALSQDIDAIAKKSGLIGKDWQKRLPNQASPFTSTIVLLVRRGNPKHIRDFGDLARPDVSVIAPNPKTSGGARLAYLAAWIYALEQPGGTPESARAFVKTLYSHVPVMDSGARQALTTFLERGLGDVLLSWENEALYAVHDLGRNQAEIVTPSISVLAEPAVAVVDRISQRHDNQELAELYVRGLFEPAAQELAARHHFRPIDPATLEKYRSSFPELTRVSVASAFGSWASAHKTHFAEGGVFDQITKAR